MGDTYLLVITPYGITDHMTSEKPPVYGRCWECKKVLKRRRMGYSQKPTISAPPHINEETGEQCEGTGWIMT